MEANTVRLSYQKIRQMGWVTCDSFAWTRSGTCLAGRGVESQPNEFIDFQWCSLSPKGDATLSTPLREHPLLISLVFIVFLSEPYWYGGYSDDAADLKNSRNL